MAIEKIKYFIDGKEHEIEAKICKSIWSKGSGLMFRRRSPPLLFVFRKEKRLTIDSLFCKPFKAIWLDEKMQATKVVDVNDWRMAISGRGKFLLEVSRFVDEDRKV